MGGGSGGSAPNVPGAPVPASAADASEARASLPRLVKDLFAFDLRTLVICVWVPVALTLMEYCFLPSALESTRAPEWAGRAVSGLMRWFPTVPYGLWRWIWWVLGCMSLGLVIPMALLKVLTGVGPRATGLRLKGTGHDAIVYGILLAVFLPVVWWASTRGDFRSTYPFYKPAGRGPVGIDFVAFEAIYFLQFLFIEWFFRGFMVLGLKPKLGRASILVMLAPYCMIHFHKPLLEALGAIGAGAVLGTLSYRTGTIVYGWFLHYAVALTMDLLSLHQMGRL